MRVLIALDEHHRSIHDRDHRAVDGELVSPMIVTCSNDTCGACQSEWFGLVSHGGCTAAMVVERPGVTEADLRTRIHDWLDCLGVVERVVDAVIDDGFGGTPLVDPVVAVGEVIDDHIAEIIEICATYPVGTVVNRLGSLVAPRRPDLAA